MLVCIDPGHGGSDPGTTAGAIDEKVINLDIGLKLRDILNRVPGIDVIMTRDSDKYVSLEERSRISNNAGADLFVSIHCNASSSPYAKGTETYYHFQKTSNIPFAQAVHYNVVTKLEMFDRGVKPDSSLYSIGLAVLRNTNATACLIEVGFLSNQEDESKLNNPDFRARAAEAIADGIREYSGIKIPLIPEDWYIFLILAGAGIIGYFLLGRLFPR